MTVSLRDLGGAVLFSQDLEPVGLAGGLRRGGGVRRRLCRGRLSTDRSHPQC